jgi:hypothetical protein
MRALPGLDWFDLIEFYAFRVVLLISFLWTLYQILKKKLKEWGAVISAPSKTPPTSSPRP